MTEALIKGPHEPRFQAADVVEVTVAQEDVPDAGGVDGGREQPLNQAEAAARVEQDTRGRRLDEDRGLIALQVQGAAET